MTYLKSKLFLLIIFYNGTFLIVEMLIVCNMNEFIYYHVIELILTRSGLVIGFIGLIYIVTTSNSSAIAQFTHSKIHYNTY
jgi:hypothetical protein